MKTKRTTNFLQIEKNFHMGIFDNEYVKPHIDHEFDKANADLTQKINNLLRFLYAPISHIQNRQLTADKILGILREHYCDTIAVEAVRMALTNKINHSEDIIYNIHKLIFGYDSNFVFINIIDYNAIISAFQKAIAEIPSGEYCIAAERFSSLSILAKQLDCIFKSMDECIQQKIYEIALPANCVNTTWAELSPLRITIRFKSYFYDVIFGEIVDRTTDDSKSNPVLSDMTSSLLTNKLKEAIDGELLISAYRMAIKDIPHSSLYKQLNELNEHLDMLSYSLQSSTA